MYWLCMIATIPLATGNKLNCFISARGMLAIVWHCVLLFCCFFFVCVFLLIFYMLINHLLKRKLCLVNLIESHLITRDNQFGFEKKHSIDLYIFTVKYVIKT